MGTRQNPDGATCAFPYCKDAAVHLPPLPDDFYNPWGFVAMEDALPTVRRVEPELDAAQRNLPVCMRHQFFAVGFQDFVNCGLVVEDYEALLDELLVRAGIPLDSCYDTDAHGRQRHRITLCSFAPLTTAALLAGCGK